MIDPRIWDSEQVMKLSPEGFKVYIYLISQADDDGKLAISYQMILSRVFPFGKIKVEQVEELVRDMDKTGLIILYSVAGKEFAKHPNWTRYQKIDRPQKSNVPSPEDGEYIKKAIPAASRRAIASRYGVIKKGDHAEAKCSYCGSVGTVSMTSDSYVHFADLEIDHIVPEKQGGSGEPDNLILACMKCNRSKRDKIGDREVIDDYLTITSTNGIEVKGIEVKETVSTPVAPTLRTKSEPSMHYDFDKSLWYGISDEQVDLWGQAYPACDVDLELRKMGEWCKAAGAKGIKKNWKKFINNWLSRCQDSGGSEKGKPAWKQKQYSR